MKPWRVELMPQPSCVRCFIVLLMSTSVHAARRLTVNGSQILDDGNAVTLRGFNFDFQLGHADLHMPNVTAHDRNVTRLLPGTNLARLVMVHWDDGGTVPSGHDCRSADASSGHLTAACLWQFDDVLGWATQSMWSTVTLRGSLAAGDGGEGATVFTNTTLRAQLISMWGFLAARYAHIDRVAGYEVMSEPRTDHPAAEVHQFHADACAAVWAADPRAICFIGPTPFYDRYNLGPEYILDGPVVYAANLFEPKLWISGAPTAAVAWGATARCCDVADKIACGGKPLCDKNVTLNRAWLAELLQPATDFGRQHDVPVWIDQWGVHADAGTGEADRAAYLADALAVFAGAGVHWSYWIWRSGYHCSEPAGAPQPDYAIYCGPRADGTYDFFGTAVNELGRYIGPTAGHRATGRREM